MDLFPLPRTSMLSLAQETSPSITVSFSELAPLTSLISLVLIKKLLAAQFTTIRVPNFKMQLTSDLLTGNQPAVHEIGLAL